MNNAEQPGKHCEPDAFDGICQKHGVPVEQCWSYKPTHQPQAKPVDGEIRESIDAILLRHGKASRHLRNDIIAFMRNQLKLSRALREDIVFALTGDSYGEELYVDDKAKHLANNLELLFSARLQAAVAEAQVKSYRAGLNDLHPDMYTQSELDEAVRTARKEEL